MRRKRRQGIRIQILSERKRSKWEADLKKARIAFTQHKNRLEKRAVPESRAEGKGKRKRGGREKKTHARHAKKKKSEVLYDPRTASPKRRKGEATHKAILEGKRGEKERTSISNNRDEMEEGRRCGDEKKLITILEKKRPRFWPLGERNVNKELYPKKAIVKRESGKERHQYHRGGKE